MCNCHTADAGMYHVHQWKGQIHHVEFDFANICEEDRSNDLSVKAMILGACFAKAL